MADTPWLGDACSLVDAFRRRERSPKEELDAVYAAVDASQLNAVCYTDREAAYATARAADVSLPFGGVPIGVKELEEVAGWPDTGASVALADHKAASDSTMMQRLRAAGVVLAAQTTASEMGAINVTATLQHGTTGNPWNPARTPGGSSGGSSAVVAGGLVTIATGGDGGGSIRIPAGFTGLVGLKTTFGRIPRGPRLHLGNFTVTTGCLARSVRDTARWFDCTNGFDSRDPYSLPRVDGWEAGLGTFRDQLRGLRVAVLPDLGGAAVVADDTIAMVERAGAALIGWAGLRRVDVHAALPAAGAAWGLTGSISLRRAFGDRWPDCKDQLTPVVRFALESAERHWNLEANVRAEERRTALNEAMAALFDAADLVICATNPATAFAAEGPPPNVFGGKSAKPINNGALTIPANIYGNPGISVPIGTAADGLPVGMQIMAGHHREQWLLDLALLCEREQPWPLVAPGAPH